MIPHQRVCLQLLGKEKLEERERREHHNLFLIIKTDLPANFTPMVTFDEGEGCRFSSAVAALLTNTILCTASPTSILCVYVDTIS